MAHRTPWAPSGFSVGTTVQAGHNPPGSTVVNLLGFAKAAVTGKPPKVGENHEVGY